LSRVAELDRITDVRNSQRKQHDDLRRRRLDEFMAGFSIITTRLKEMYQMITLGGDAELELVDSLDPFSEGIVFRSVAALLVVTVAAHHTTTVLRPFFRDYPDEPVPEEKFWTFGARKINRGRHTDHPAGRHSTQTKQ